MSFLGRRRVPPDAYTRLVFTQSCLLVVLVLLRRVTAETAPSFSTLSFPEGRKLRPALTSAPKRKPVCPAEPGRDLL